MYAETIEGVYARLLERPTLNLEQAVTTLRKPHVTLAGIGSQQYFYSSLNLESTCWGGRMVQAVACRAALYGFNSHPQLFFHNSKFIHWNLLFAPLTFYTLFYSLLRLHVTSCSKRCNFPIIQQTPITKNIVKSAKIIASITILRFSFPCSEQS